MARTREYRGRERRRRQMYVTRNTEYHFCDERCIAVRDRQTGSWLPSHLALHRSLTGGIAVLPDGALMPQPGTPRVGEGLYFGRGGRVLVTSALRDIQRPPKETLSQYPCDE